MRRARKGQADNEPETTKPSDPGKESSLEELRRHRIVRVKRQNEKLGLDLKKARGELVSFDALKREVLEANQVVKTQLLALPYKLSESLASVGEPREVARILHDAIVQACNDLAYSELSQPEENICPLCGREKRS